VLDAADPAYAEISDHVGSQVDTALDMHLRRSNVSVMESRTNSPAVMTARPLSAGGMPQQKLEEVTGKVVAKI
jgi:hypothetical protein